MCKSTRTVGCAVLALGGLLSSCANETETGVKTLAANVAKSQLRGYDLGPPFPAGFRDSGMVNGYGEGEWIPFIAIIEGSKLEDADINQGGAGDGQYRVGIIMPTYSERNNANALIDLATSGTYGVQPVAPIPDPFDNGWLIENGYDPIVLGAWSENGEHDPAPVILGAAQRTGPTRFGGNVSSVSVGVSFQLTQPTTNVELRFAVYMAPPGLEPVAPGGATYASRNPGGALGACDFHPGPGPLFVGYEVNDPTGIATVPIRCDRTNCEGDNDCTPGQTCDSGSGECEQPCVSDATCPTDQICEDGVCTNPPPACVDDEDCAGWHCIGGYCTPDCPEVCEGDVEFCNEMDRCLPPGGENPPCTTDAQCPGGELCEDGHCAPPSPPCDMSCPAGDQCVDGVCVPPDQPCTDDSQCPGGELCVDGSCQTGEPPCPEGTCPACTSDPDCDGGDLCIEGVCVPSNPPEACTDASQCDTGELCEAGFCTPPPGDCGPGGTCPTGELCETPGGPGTCIPEHPPVPCVDASACPTGDLCVGGFCTPPGGDFHPPIPCDAISDCPTGDLCAGGFCIPPDDAVHPPIPCDAASDCPFGDLCTGGFCTPPGSYTPPTGPCVESSDCEFAYCVDQQCVPPHPPIVCDDATDCPTGDACTGGFCIPPGWEPPGTQPPPNACASSSECPTGELCLGGFCAPPDGTPHPPIPCASAGDCPSGDLCTEGFCHPPGTSLPPGGACVESSDCEFAYCVDQQCIPPHPPVPCTSVSNCPSGDACVEGFCLPPGWQPPGGWEPPHTGTCVESSDCEFAYCVDQQCTPPHPAVPCASLGDCPSGDTCTGGYCTPPGGTGTACTGEAQCDALHDCVGGVCVPAPGEDCVESSDCEFGFCVDQQCESPHPPIPCSDETDCPTGDACVAGWCFGDVPCADDTDCPGGTTCEGGFCRPGDEPEPCTTTSDCPTCSGSDDVCVAVVCEEGFCRPASGGTGETGGACGAGAPCPSGWSCTAGFCLPSGGGGGGCANDLECPGGYGCQSGYCVDLTPPPGCTASYECGAGGYCESGFCTGGDGAETCTTADDCSASSGGDDVGAACLGGVCTGGDYVGTSGPCDSDEDCSPGEVCEFDVDTGAGTCTRVEGMCELDGDCPSGQGCISGWCGVPCASSDACGGGVCVNGRCGTACATYDQCGAFEACLGGGCVPWYSSVGGSGGSQANWQVEIPGNETTLGGGCQAAPGRVPAGLPLIVIMLVLGVPAAFVVRHRRTGIMRRKRS